MPKPANALYDPTWGWNPPNRFQQERAWSEVVMHENSSLQRECERLEVNVLVSQVNKEKHIQSVHEKQNRELDRRGSSARGHKWPGGPACGTDAVAAPRAPWFEDSDIWRSELLKRQVASMSACGEEWQKHV